MTAEQKRALRAQIWMIRDTLNAAVCQCGRAIDGADGTPAVMDFLALSQAIRAIDDHPAMKAINRKTMPDFPGSK